MRRHARMHILFAELRLENHVGGNGEQENGDEPLEHFRVAGLHEPRAGGGANDGKERAQPAFARRNHPGPRIMPRGAARTEAGLEFVRAERELGRQREAEQHGDGDKTAPAGDGIHKTRNESGEEEDWKRPRGKIRAERGGHVTPKQTSIASAVKRDCARVRERPGTA